MNKFSSSLGDLNCHLQLSTSVKLSYFLLTLSKYCILFFHEPKQFSRSIVTQTQLNKKRNKTTSAPLNDMCETRKVISTVFFSLFLQLSSLATTAAHVCLFFLHCYKHMKDEEKNSGSLPLMLCCTTVIHCLDSDCRYLVHSFNLRKTTRAYKLSLSLSLFRLTLMVMRLSLFKETCTSSLTHGTFFVLLRRTCLYVTR